MFFRILNNFRAVAIIASIGAFLFSCQKEADPVVISTFQPTSGDYGSEISITGSSFDPNAQNNTVLFEGKEAKVLTASTSQLVVAVPVGGITGKITVKAGGRQATSTDDFTVTAGSWNSKADFNKGTESVRDLSFSIGGDAYIHITQHTVNGSSVAGSLWMFSSVNNNWVQKKELDPSLSPSSGYAWGSEDKGYILQYQKLWEYSPANNAWVQKKTLPVTLNTDNVIGAFYVNSINRACVVTNAGNWFLYNAVDDVWEYNQGAPFAGSLTTNGGTRRVQGAHDNGFLLIGTEVWKYTTNNQWTQLPAFPGYDLDFTFGINNELYAGLAGEDYSANNFYVYKEAQNKWVKKAVMGGTYRYWPLYFTLSDKGYMGMGVKTPGDALIYDFHQYNP